MARSYPGFFLLAAFVGNLGLSIARADEPFSLKNYTPPAESKKDEPIAKEFSLDKAVRFMDAAALHWTKSKGCFSCHSNYSFLYARPMISAQAPAHADIRSALEEMVAKRWVTGKPRWDAEVVATAAALAYNDALTTKKLHPLTKTALDRMWTVQRKNGSFAWLKLNQPPMEYDEHYGVTLAALAVGVAPEGYANTGPARQGIAAIRGWLKANPPQNLHHQAMMLWASTYIDELMAPEQRKEVVTELLGKQLPDGGWSAASLGNWKRMDKREQDLATSDGYGTGFRIFLARRAGVPADDPAVQKGLAWLKTNQRASGRWFTRSLTNDDNKHYLTHIGTAFAVMALASCD